MVRTAVYNVLIQPHIKPGGGIYTQVMNGSVFFGVLIIDADLVLVDKLHKEILVIQFPDPRIYFQEQAGGAIIAEEQAAISIPDKVLVIAELDVKIFSGIEINGGPVIEVVYACLLEILIIPCTRYGMELVDTIHDKLGASLLVVRQVSRPAQLAGDHAAEGEPFGIEEYPLMIPGLIGLGLLDGRVDRQEKILFIHLVEIGLIL